MEAELESKRAEDVGRQAEEDRKNAEIKALEVEALKRQIAAIQEQNLPTAGQTEQSKLNNSPTSQRSNCCENS